MENIQFLQSLGLTKNEIKVYVSLLKIGQSTSSKIIKDVGINSSKVYESLERLLKKGLISYSLIKNKKNWTAENPDKINQLLQKEKEQLNLKIKVSEDIINNLKLSINTERKASTYKIYEGTQGIKTARENAINILNKNDIFYLILSNFSGENKLEAYFEDFQKRRAKKGIHYRAIFNNNLKHIIEKRGNQKNSIVKYITPEFLAPTWIEIYKDTVAIGVMGNNPSLFVIKNKDITTGFINYFNGLWKIAK